MLYIVCIFMLRLDRPCVCVCVCLRGGGVMDRRKYAGQSDFVIDILKRHGNF